MAQNNETRTVEIIVNGVKANASLKEMNAAAAVLYNQFQKMSADDPGRAKLLADLQEMRGRVNKVKDEVKGVNESAGMMKQAFANAFALLTGGGVVALAGKLLSFFTDSRAEYEASAKVSADLEATLRSTAHAAGLTADEIKKIGEERAKVTLFDDDDTNKASAMLLTFTNIKKGVFEDAIPAIQDIATKMGGDGPADLKGASIQVGKALNDPIAGITALTRVGVTFTEQQKDQIKAMVKAGDTAGAQKLILSELNKEFGGSAEAARKAAGGMATLNMWWGETKESVGALVSGALNKFSEWLSRVIDYSQPLIDMLAGIGAEFAAYYREVMDVVESLGFFNAKTDTAKIAVDILKGALTLLLIPFRAALQVSRYLVDNFIEWYNTSELLRGVLGGLGASIVSLFITVKQAATDILGGVADIIVGIFTLDKAKIVAGFKSAFNATADLALESGARAAKAFMDGYAANKDNKIIRSVQVETKETSSAEEAVVAGKDSPAGESEKDRKARLAREKREAAERARQLKAEEEAARHQQEVLYNLAEAAMITRSTQRERELAAIEFDALRKSLTVTGTEKEKDAAIALINQEAHEKKLALQARFDKEDREQQELFIGQQLDDIEEDEARKQAAFEVMLDAGLLSQQAHDKARYDARRIALERELSLIESTLGKESKEYKRVRTEMLKNDEKFNSDTTANDKKTQQAKYELAQMSLRTAGDVVQTTIDLLFQDEAARKKHHNLYTALAAAKIIVDGVQEVAAIWQYSAEQPENVPTAGAWGLALGGIQTAMAVARTAYGLSQLQEFKFAKGGRTGTGTGLAGSPMGQLMQMSGMMVGGDGRLRDNTGFAVAGVVHEDEYVIPKWQLADPQVAAVAQWLEARRLRGFADGGGTSAAALPAAAAAPESEGELSYAVLSQMLGELRTLNQRLAGVETWQREFRVINSLQETDQGLAELKQVRHENGIRA
jgi:hypothetical protein